MNWRERLVRRLGGVMPERHGPMSVDAIVERAEDLTIGFYDPGQDDIDAPEVWTPPPGAMRDPDRPSSHL